MATFSPITNVAIAAEPLAPSLSKSDKARSVLMLVCHPPLLAPQLRSSLLSLKDTLAADFHIELVFAPTATALRQQLETLRQAEAHYEMIVLLGESDGTQLQFGTQAALRWTELATSVLLPFEPKVLLLLCATGDPHWPVVPLFDGVPMLREMYVAPLLDVRLQTDVLKFLISYGLTPTLSEADQAFSQQVAAHLLAAGTILHWTWRVALQQRIFQTFELLDEMEKLEVAAELMHRAAQLASEPKS